MNTVIVKTGRDESLRRFHPWLYSGAIRSADHPPAQGDTVEVIGADGEWLARGAFSPHSQIRVRVWTFARDESVDEAFFRNRFERALRLRETLPSLKDVTALRLVNAESDGLAGVIVDRYGDWLVCQFLSAGAERWKEVIAAELARLLPVRGIYERSDTDSRTKEGLEPVAGTLAGEHPPELIEVRENGIRFFVDVRRGHKTGLYLDQRENRAHVRPLAKGKEVLNCFSYTGGFGLSAALGGASRVTHIDTSGDVLALARQNARLNGLDDESAEYLEDDVFTALRAFRDRGRRFDIVVLDPPKFVASAQQVARGSRGYKDINLLAMKLLREGGHLFTFSCSAHVTPPLFYKIVADAAVDAGRDARIIRYLFQAADHPVSLPFPEGLYLKGLLCRVW